MSVVINTLHLTGNSLGTFSQSGAGRMFLVHLGEICICWIYVFFIYASLFTVKGSKSTKKWKNTQKQTIYNISVQHHTQWRLLINLFFRCASCSLGNRKLNISWHSETIFISFVQNNFIKKWFTTKSKLLMSLLFRGQASRPYSNAGTHLLLRGWPRKPKNVFNPLMVTQGTVVQWYSGSMLNRLRT